MKAPIIFRELRIWRHCPEIRPHVARGVAWRVVWWFVRPPSVIIALPVALLGEVLRFAATGFDFLASIICWPANWISSKRQDCVSAAHDILDWKEIQSRIDKDTTQ
jgi:hypothetical protein